MKLTKRREEKRSTIVDGETYYYQLLEIPFREGVELLCDHFSPPLRVSDRGLGEHEALRLLELEITKRRSELA